MLLLSVNLFSQKIEFNRYDGILKATEYQVYKGYPPYTNTVHYKNDDYINEITYTKYFKNFGVGGGIDFYKYLKATPIAIPLFVEYKTPTKYWSLTEQIGVSNYFYRDDYALGGFSNTKFQINIPIKDFVFDVGAGYRLQHKWGRNSHYSHYNNISHYRALFVGVVYKWSKLEKYTH